MIKTILPATHNSPETAYVVNDYPYGFRLRCKIRYWLETKAKKGVRFCSQTTNPKAAGEVWNKPKTSTYSCVAGGMYLDENNHVQWDSVTEYTDTDKARQFLETFGENAANFPLLKYWVALKEAFNKEKESRGNPEYGTPSYREAYIAALKSTAHLKSI